MSFDSTIQLALMVLQLLFSIFVLCTVVVKWKSHSLKGLMCAVILFGFSIPSLLGVVTWCLIVSLNQGFNRGNYQFIQTISQIVSLVQLLLPLLTLAALLTYVFLRKPEGSQQSRRFQISEIDSPDSPQQHRYVASGVAPIADSIPAKAWKTDVAPALRIGILRKREWAFLLDVLPAIAFNFGCVTIIFQMANNHTSNLFSSVLNGLSILVTFGLLIYLPFKDSIYGVSFGKLISRCRVVRNRDGTPIGPGESFIRNILFLIPLMALVELAVASLRPDRKRLGDLMAGTTVVTGEPDFLNGVENEHKEQKLNAEKAKVAKPHPLDD